MKQAIILISLVASLTILGCGKEEIKPCEKLPLVKSELDGEWNQYLLPPEQNTFFGEVYSFHFLQDSVNIRIDSHDDEITWSDPCDEPSWTDYVAAGFTLSNTLGIQGSYTDELGNVKTDGCHGVGEFSQSYQAWMCRDTLMLLWHDATIGFDRQIRLLRK